MNNWDNLLQDIIQDVPTTGNELMQEFEDFVASLKRLGFVGAEIVPSANVPNLYSLVTYPRRRPEERTIMITFRLQPHSVEMISTDDRRELEKAVELREYLEEFAKDTEFPATLRMYRARDSQPATGTLKCGDWNQLGARDVVVQIEPDELDKLVDATSAEVELRVKAADSPKLADFREDTNYRFLEFSGFIVEVEQTRRDGDSIIIKGKLQPQGETPWVD